MNKTPILMYHSIGETVPPGFAPWVVHPSRFRDQLAGLVQAGCATLTVSELVRRRAAGRSGPNRVALTFDDGFRDFLHHAMPILHEFGMTATLYVATGIVGREFHKLPVLNWGELAEIRDAGMEIGAHTVTHAALDRLRFDRALGELRDSKHELEDRLGVPIESHAYPFGFYTRETRRAVIAAGYTNACAIGYAFSAENDDPFALRRMIVRKSDASPLHLPPVALLYRLRSRGFALLRHSLTQIVGYAS